LDDWAGGAKFVEANGTSLYMEVYLVLMGGIEALTSSASIGVVLKAAHISLSAHLCTFSSSLI